MQCGQGRCGGCKAQRTRPQDEQRGVYSDNLCIRATMVYNGFGNERNLKAAIENKRSRRTLAEALAPGTVVAFLVSPSGCRLEEDSDEGRSKDGRRKTCQLELPIISDTAFDLMYALHVDILAEHDHPPTRPGSHRMHDISEDVLEESSENEDKGTPAADVHLDGACLTGTLCD